MTGVLFRAKPRTLLQRYTHLQCQSISPHGDIQRPSTASYCLRRCHNGGTTLSQHYHHALRKGTALFPNFRGKAKQSFSCNWMKLIRSSIIKDDIGGYAKYFCEQGSARFNHEHFQGQTDRFNGVWVDLSKNLAIPGSSVITDEVFSKLLSNSLDVWRSGNVSTIWLKIPIELSHLTNVASRYGFEYHHAEGRMAVLYLWLDTAVESRIPRFATHQVGVSGVVINEDTQEVLMIKERNKRYNLWKFPGGLADLGEDIAETATREVFEETGIRTEFQSILAFRQQHDQPNAFGRSDIYILCRLKPLSFELYPCSEEIEAVQWIKLDQVPHQPDTSPFSRRMAQLVTLGREHGFQCVDIASHPMESVFKNVKMQLYHRPLVTPNEI